MPINIRPRPRWLRVGMLGHSQFWKSWEVHARVPGQPEFYVIPYLRKLK